MCAVVVAYHPDSGFAERVTRIGEEVAAVLVVDNGSNTEAVAELCAIQRAGEFVELVLNEIKTKDCRAKSRDAEGA